MYILIRFEMKIMLVKGVPGRRFIFADQLPLDSYMTYTFKATEVQSSGTATVVEIMITAYSRTYKRCLSAVTWSIENLIHTYVIVYECSVFYCRKHFVV